MIISEPEIQNFKGKTRYEVSVGFENTEKFFWYSVDESFGDFVSDKSDAVLLALIIPAMHAGEDIIVKGKVSEKLCYNLSERYQHILQIVMPWLQQVEIHVDRMINTNERAEGVATGFSCGVDSFSVLADYYYSKPTDGFKISHLLFNNVGSHGKGGEQLFMNRFKAVQPVAEKIGLPLIRVNSNVDDFYDDKNLTFVRTATVRNASVPLLLQKGIGRYLYGSSISFVDQGINKNGTLGYCDTVSLPMLSTNSTDMMAVGSKYTRVEKTAQIAEIPDTYSSLNVCTRSDAIVKNCSKCNKCMRTQLTLDLTGYLERYKNAFDLDIYSQMKHSYIAQLLNSDKAMDHEILEYAAKHNIQFPVSAHIKSKLKKILGR